ncbi:MAG: FAD:protein FMN transferase [Lachnospiraceae bacterium]|nr:FAD:protein FMN transferase [Lachnospiraceae bacterium]
MKKIHLTITIFFLLFLLSGCSRNNDPVSETGFYFDTVISITIYDSSKEDVLARCLELAGEYENLLSVTREGSDIWKINHADGEAVTVSEETVSLLERALYYAELTDGRIDPSIAPLSSLWDFSSKNSGTHTVPSDEEIQEKLLHVDYHNIKIEGTSITLLDPNASIDLGFIAKGYIADKIKEYLIEEGIESAIISLGGNVLTVGNKPDQSPYIIGIQRPFGETGETMNSVSVSDLSVVSSGIYERYFESDGIFYHHILDTGTGYPVENELVGVTILSSSSLEGDALSTTCFLLGIEDGMQLISSLPDTEALFITKDGELVYTDGFRLNQSPK